MKLIDATIRLSATDLANHLACRHLTHLDLQAARGTLQPSQWRDPSTEALQKRGLEHESAYLEHLRSKGLRVVELDMGAPAVAFEAACKAMRDGTEVIFQATLTADRWLGRADVLLRVDGPSDLGDWSYEVVDTKLSAETRAGTILQLCLYSDIVGLVQGHVPERMHVVIAGRDFEPESYRTSDCFAYYRLVRGRLETAVDEGADGTYPEPVSHCDVCRWWGRCVDQRRADDHLSLVAGITRLQRRELESRGVATLENLAGIPLPLEWKPRHGSRPSMERVREQARVQLHGRVDGRPVHELLPREPLRGLARLPKPSPGDIFFDIEGDRFAYDHGLEYLLGYVEVDETGEQRYDSIWATTPRQEKAAFERFVDFVMERWEQRPGMHIYHYAPYEPSALKRLMGRHATREDEVDRMLRAGLFVDLYGVARQGVRASVERYSIKDLEQFYGFEREEELRGASLALRSFELALELGVGVDVAGDEAAVVRRYNRDDCVSTLRLRDWLEGLRRGLVDAGEEISRPEIEPDEPAEELSERQERVRAMKGRLTAQLPDERADWSAEQRARWLLAEILEWHWREEKAPWWEYYRLRTLDQFELLDEKAALSGLDFVERIGGTKRCPIDRYSYVPQDTTVGRGDTLHLADGEKLGKVEEIDEGQRFVDVKKTMAARDLNPPAAFAHDVVRAGPLPDSLMRLAEWVADNGVAGPGAHRAARDLLRRRRPRLRGGALPNAGEAVTVEVARRLATELDHAVLPVQGPPGSGKTYLGARMICELVRSGKTVGVSAVSHKVIRNLLDAAVKAAEEEGLALRCIQKVSRDPNDDENAPVIETKDYGEVREALGEGHVEVAGGTAWMWAREDFADLVDVLFVDEAGQMALANALSIAQGAESLVLLGDPQQLEQPQGGSHPEGTDVSALEHVLGGRKTLRPEQGLFLPETWRLHPNICALTSEQFYEDRLRSRDGMERQRLVDAGAFAGAGLWFVPVEHDGNQSSSAEEAEIVTRIVAGLLDSGAAWIDQDGEQKPLTIDDILVVAPYNAQVSEIAALRPDAHVGTVDRFQGQEAPVVIYSMATSTPEDAPRGMEFLYSPNRFNVATSRARCACILVASPRLLEPECRTPRQVILANALCRYRELSQTASTVARPSEGEA